VTDHEQLSRRRFLARAGKAGATAAAAGVLSYLLYDGKGPDGVEELAAKPLELPDYSVAGKEGQIAIARGDDRAKTLAAAVAALGGMESFIRSGDRVLIKVNAAFASPASLCATSHPDAVAEMIRLCQKAGAREVRVSDNPINDPDSCFRLTGIGKAASDSGAKVIVPRPSSFRNFSLKDASLIREWPLLHEPLDGVNKVIGMAPLKDHHRSGASMTMKNWYGLLGGRRNVFHQDINTIIKELALLIRPTLVVLDGTHTMMTNGPTGGSLADLKQTNTMIVGTDQVAVDAFGVTLLERTTSDLPYIDQAAQAGAGTADYKSLQPKEVA
jgi:uncharacterized protein (DUF362 family)